MKKNNNIILKPILESIKKGDKENLAFYVHPSATKRDIAENLLLLFQKIKIQRINTVNLPGKKVRTVKGMGQRQRRKKAYIKLAPGYGINLSDTI